MTTLPQFIEETGKSFEGEFPCTHHAAECSGHCNITKYFSFLRLSIEQAYRMGESDGFVEGGKAILNNPKLQGND